MEAPLIGLSRMPRIEEGEKEGSEVGWSGQEKSFHSVVAQCLDDGGEEVCEAHAHDGCCLDEDK